MARRRPRWTAVTRYRFNDQQLENDTPEDTTTVIMGDNDGKGSLVNEGLEEAEVPKPFIFEEVTEGEQLQMLSTSTGSDVTKSKADVLEEKDSAMRHHQSHPLPKLYGFEEIPPDLTKLSPLEYYPLDPSVDPVRLLVVLPHFGDPYSTVQCNLFVVPFAHHHYCYGAISNTRGNKTVTSNIIVNCEVKSITRNLEVFLRHFREEYIAKVIWIREICIYPGDNPYHQTPEWREWIFDRACKVHNMADVMEGLHDGGILEKEKQFTVRQKDWSKVIRDVKLPTHYPIPLRTFSNEQIKGDQNAIQRVPHQYLPLDLVAEEIRLVVLLPATDESAPLVGHFAHESIFGAAEYVCLSYSWGSQQKTEELTLNGQLIYITQNLDQALRDIRTAVHPTVIWVGK